MAPKLRKMIKTRKVEKMYKKTSMFLALRMFMIGVRRKRRMGEFIEERLIKGKIKPAFNIFAIAANEQISRHARSMVFDACFSLL